MRRNLLPVLALVITTFPGTALGASINFQLLTWDSTQATGVLPSTEGVKPSTPLPTNGDWLVSTNDDQQLPAGFNPAGSLSHNFADLGGSGGSGFSMAPSLSGNLTIDFTSNGLNSWDADVTSQAYTGWATPTVFMNQFLVTPGSSAATDPLYNVDGLPNSGTWQSSGANNWSFEVQADFYFATNADGNPDPLDIDVTFDSEQQEGYLIPVHQLTPAGMAAVTLDDPAGFYAGNFEQYLLDEIAPRLPADATYLLVTQMDKTNPVYAQPGLPVSLGSLFGNTTFAYTTQTIPEPGTALLVGIATSLGLLRRRS